LVSFDVRTLSNIFDWLIALCYYLFAYFFVVDGLHLAEFAYFVAFPILVFFVWTSTMIHELGHAAAAWMQGWRVHAINVAGLSFLPISRRFRFEPNAQFNAIGGFVFSSVTEGKDWATGQWKIILAGPLANLFVAIGFYTTLPSNLDGFNSGLLAISGTSLLMGISNLMPHRLSNGWSNDGLALIEIANGQRPTHFQFASAKALSMEYDNLPINDCLEQILIFDSFTMLEPEEKAKVHLALYYLAFGRGDIEAASKIWNEQISNQPSLSPSDWLSHALCLTLSGKNTDEPREILARFSELAPEIGFFWWRTKAAVELVEGNYAISKIAAQNAERAAIQARLKPDSDDRALLRAAKRGGHLKRFKLNLSLPQSPP
jgi:tetratricopeptide (TPR) repeat protein